MSKRRILYLPIEIKARELPGKAFLATHAVERGWIVVSGEQSDVHKFMQNGPVGAYVEISIPERKAERLKQLSNAGFRIANLCEESLMYWNGRDYCHSRLGVGSLRWVDRLLAIGVKNAGHIEAYRPEFTEKIAITGNPRFDSLLPPLRRIYEAKAKAIRRRLGRFLLVNSNFGLINPYRLEGDPIDRLRRQGDIADDRHADFVRGHVEYKKRQMQGIRSLLETLASSKAINRIVVRPHPSENHQTWRDWAVPLGIQVEYEGSANEWMIAADAVLHTGCTTGIEGLFLDRPVFSYAPEPSAEYLKLSDRVSWQISSPEEIEIRLKKIEQMTEKEIKESFTQERGVLSSYVSNLQPPFAIERILDELDRFDLPVFTSVEITGINAHTSSSFGRTLRNWIQKLNPQMVTRKQQKFPGVGLSELMHAADIWIANRAASQRPQIDRLRGNIHVWH